jgi:hypothetical protein
VFAASVAAASDHCCYYDCISGGSVGGVADGRGGVKPVPIGPILRSILAACEEIGMCSSEVSRLPLTTRSGRKRWVHVPKGACTALAYRAKNVDCSDGNSCSSGIYEGRAGESLLMDLIRNEDVIFVRPTKFHLHSGGVVNIRPSGTTGR